VNVSIVYGVMPPEVYHAARPKVAAATAAGRLDRRPSIVAGVSSVSKILLSALAFSQIHGLFNICELLHLSGVLAN
jgi:hypothetical protein